MVSMRFVLHFLDGCGFAPTTFKTSEAGSGLAEIGFGRGAAQRAPPRRGEMPTPKILDVWKPAQFRNSRSWRDVELRVRTPRRARSLSALEAALASNDAEAEAPRRCRSRTAPTRSAQAHAWRRASRSASIDGGLGWHASRREVAQARAPSTELARPTPQYLNSADAPTRAQPRRLQSSRWAGLTRRSARLWTGGNSCCNGRLGHPCRCNPAQTPSITLPATRSTTLPSRR